MPLKCVKREPIYIRLDDKDKIFELLKHNKYTLYKHIGNNLINVGDIYANTVEEAEHLALLNHIKYDIITVTEFLK